MQSARSAKSPQVIMHLQDPPPGQPARDRAAAAIEVRDVRVQLGGLPILRGVNLRVPAGQLIALIGPNGSGKTTLLRALLGLQKVSAGEVRLFGQSSLEADLP